MSIDKNVRLLEVAGAICDDIDVDWETQDSDNALRQLQRLDGVARAFRDLRRQDADTDAQSNAAHPADLFRWGHLNVLEKLGEGGFGEVYRAWDSTLEREVALKLRRVGPSRSGGSGRQYIQEARRLARLRHPNVLAIHGADLHDGRVGLWTELVGGRTLEQRLEEDGPMGPNEAILIGRDLCLALAAVHGAGLVHGDVKAANIIREKGGRLVLTDLGSATEITDRKDAGEAVSISPLTTAPEVLEGGSPTPAADIYSLGVLLYRLLGDGYPVETQDLSTLMDLHKRGERRPLLDFRPDLPAGLVRLVERATASVPEDRFASAGKMEQALNEVLQQTQSVEGDAAVIQPTKTRRWLPATVGAVTVAAVLILAFLGIVNRKPAADPVGLKHSPLAVVQPQPDSPENTIHVLPLPPLEITAALFRGRDGSKETLSPTDTIAPGDQLSMEVQADEAVHLYIVNEDQDGAFFVLFPLPGLDTTNPLSGAKTHRLPGRRNGAVQDWQVTTAGGTETFMVVASREPLEELEAELNRSPAAAAGRKVGDPVQTLLTRGVGGVVAAPTASQAHTGGRVDTLYRQLLQRQESDHNVWVQRFVLANPKE